MMNENMTYTVQQMVTTTGLSAHTLRYYEDLGLIDVVQRAPNGHRRYTDEDIERIEFLKKMRHTGLSLDDIKAFLDLYKQGEQTASERRTIMEEQRENVRQQIAELQEVEAFITNKINGYIKEENNTYSYQKEITSHE
ncbi:MAG: MerR family transcriptional regulator [Chloroflexota bacterium]